MVVANAAVKTDSPAALPSKINVYYWDPLITWKMRRYPDKLTNLVLVGLFCVVSMSVEKHTSQNEFDLSSLLFKTFILALK